MYTSGDIKQQSKSPQSLHSHYSTGKLSASGGYLARPKLGALKNLFSKGYSSMRPLSYYGLEKKKKSRKPNAPKMDYRKKPDYAETAYRDAVSRLRILLAESYTPIKRPLRELDSAGEETDNQSVLSGLSRHSRLGHAYYHTKPILTRKYPYYTPTTPRTTFNLSTVCADKANTDPQTKWDTNTAPPELMSFIERQEEYIEQLEKESRFCREELSTLLSKVKDVISENENLHEKQKNTLIKSVFDHLETETETETELDMIKKGRSKSKSPRRNPILEGPTIVFESRISELEAQLTQAKIDLKKAQDENESYRKKINDGSISSELGYDTYKKQIDSLHREKSVLQETVAKLQNALGQLREKENDCSDKVKRSLDVAEQAQYEKTAAEHEIRRLKDELERQHAKVRDAITEQSRRIADERNAVERRYTQQIEQLTNELGVQWETTSKIQLELDKQRREDSDLRRELAQKQAYIDELKKEMQSKILSMQSDIGVSSAEKSALEQQINNLQLANERQERSSKAEQTRMHAEMQSLRQRLDRADADLIHSRRENIRLTEQVAALEKEIKINSAMTDERSKRSGEIIALPPPKEDREKEVSSMINNLEAKHAATVAELEGMIQSQNQLMDKLSNECHALTQKLEDSSSRHKEEIRELQSSLSFLTSRLGQHQVKPPDIKDGSSFYPSTIEHQSPLPRKRIEPAPSVINDTNESFSTRPNNYPQSNSTIVPKKSIAEPKTPKESLSLITNNETDIVSPSKSDLNKEKIDEVKEKDEKSNDKLDIENIPKIDDVERKIREDIRNSKLNNEALKEFNTNGNNQPAYEETAYPEQQYYDQQGYNQQYGQQQYDQQYNSYGDPNMQYNDPNIQYDPNQTHYDPALYAEQEYDPNNPNQQYMTQEQYNQQYGYSDPNMQYESTYDTPFQKTYDQQGTYQQEGEPTITGMTSEQKSEVKPNEQKPTTPQKVQEFPDTTETNLPSLEKQRTSSKSPSPTLRTKTGSQEKLLPKSPSPTN